MADTEPVALDPEVQAAIRSGRAEAEQGLAELRMIELPLINAIEPGHLVARLLTFRAEHR